MACSLHDVADPWVNRNNNTTYQRLVYMHSYTGLPNISFGLVDSMLAQKKDVDHYRRSGR